MLATLTPIGQMRHRITLQRQTNPTRNDYGEEVPGTWNDVATVWAAITPLVLIGNEFIQGQQVHAKRILRINIRYRADVIPAMRAKMGKRIFNFQTVSDKDERNIELEIRAEEAV